MKLKKPVNMFQCSRCRRTVVTHNTVLKCCEGIIKLEGIGDNMKEKKVRIKVSGYIEMSQESYNRIKNGYGEDLHMGLVYSMHMGYTDTKGLEFITPD